MPEEVRADLLLGRDTLSPGLIKAGQAASDASGNIRQLTRDLYEVGKQRATPVVDLQDDKATAKLTDVSQRLRDLGARVANPEVRLDDKEAQASLAAMRVKLDTLGKKVSSPRVTLEGVDRAEAQILKLDLELDALNRKHASPSVSGSGGFLKSLVTTGGWSRLLGLLPGVSGGGGSGAAGAAEGAGAAGAESGARLLLTPGGAAAGLGALTAGLPIISSLIDALVGQGIGSGGALAGAGLVKQFQPGVLVPGLTNIQKTLSTVAQSFGPSLGLLLASFGKTIQGLAPVMAKFFASTLPFMKQFFTLAGAAGKTLLPAMTQALEQMAKSGALAALTQGFVYLIQGVAGFIKAIGPGFKAGALIFRAVMDGIRGLLYGLGDTFGFLGKLMGNWLTNTHQLWDTFRHDTATIFDNVRHGIALDWDLIFNNTIGRMIRGVHDIGAEWDTWRHNTATIFDQVRHDIASAWDQIWNDTIGRVERGINDVTGWFHKLPGDVQNALRGLGSLLETIGKDALGMLWSGFKSIGSSILGWFKGFGGSVLSALKSVFGIASPSRAMFDIGRNLGLGLEHGLKSHFAPIKATAGNLGGSVTSWITAALHDAGKPLSWLPALQRLVSLESGGNPRAVDPISVLGQHAEGLWQMLPSTFYSYGGRGSLFNPVVEGIAALRYISSRYGSPFNIPGLFSGGYQGYAAGGVITEPIIGLGLQTGRGYGFGERGPEMVIPAGSGGGRVVVEFAGGSGDFDQFMLTWIRRHARIRGGGNVQLAFGRS